MPAFKAKRKPKKTEEGRLPAILIAVLMLCAFFLFLGAVVSYHATHGTAEDQPWIRHEEIPDWVDVQLVNVNGTGRRGTPLSEVNDIVIHYVGNPGTTAQQNRDYFNLPDTQVSAHFLVGLYGEVIQCIPLTEKCSATNERNRDTIAIEVCHPKEDGQFTMETYRSVVKLTAWLCDYCHLDRSRVIRHYDVTGKLCPLYYVEHPEAWEAFMKDVAQAKVD